MNAKQMCVIYWCMGVGLLSMGGICHAQAADPLLPVLAKRLYVSGQMLQTTGPESKKGRLEDLELFWLAEALEMNEQPEAADQYRLYLKNYFEKSPLLVLLPAIPKDTPALEEFSPDAEWSRLLKTAYRQIDKKYQSNTDPGFQAFTELFLNQSNVESEAETVSGLRVFLQKYPDSDFSGWVAYQLAWWEWLQNQGSTQGLADFWTQHKEHPLAAECMEAMDVPYFSPRRLAMLSALLPGLGEEVLEPGLHLSSGLWYSEILFAAGAIGFALAGQDHNRMENLTGALIFTNLLFLNHQGSAEKTFVLAHRRNWAEKRSFNLERIDVPVIGSGHFQVPASLPQVTESMANEFIFSVLYQTQSAGSGFANQGWVEDCQLVNLGFKGEYMASLIDIYRSKAFSMGMAAVPNGRIYFNQVHKKQNQEFAEGLAIQELTAGLDAALLFRFDMGGPALQLRISGGPALRSRSLAFNQYTYNQQQPVTSGAVALQWGGYSGAYWHLGFFMEDSFQAEEMQVFSQSVSIPSRSLGWQFGLGIRF